MLSDLRGVVGYELVPGMRVGVGFQQENWWGNGSEGARIYSAQLHYTPGGVPKGAE